MICQVIAPGICHGLDCFVDLVDSINRGPSAVGLELLDSACCYLLRLFHDGIEAIISCIPTLQQLLLVDMVTEPGFVNLVSEDKKVRPLANACLVDFAEIWRVDDLAGGCRFWVSYFADMLHELL